MENALSQREIYMAGRTAIARRGPSVPCRELLEMGAIQGRVLDFGGGRGADADFLREMGFDVEIYDINFFPSEPSDDHEFDTILCTYVLNVVPRREQDAILGRIWLNLHPEGSAFITVRADIEGVQRGRTFQRDVRLRFPVVRSDAAGRTYLMTYDDLEV